MTRNLTSLENFRRMIEHCDPQWMPLDLPCTPPVHDRLVAKVGQDLTAAFGLDFRGCGSGTRGNPAAWREAFRGIGNPVADDAEIDPFGVTHIKPPAESVGEATHFRTMLHPLEAITDVAQLPKLPWPTVITPAQCDEIRQQADRTHAEGRVLQGGCECTQFECAWYVRGMDNLFMDLAEGNGIADWLLDYFTERSIHVVRAYCENGVDVIGLGDDVGTQRGMMMSVPTWREHLKPRLKRVIDAIRAAQADRHVYVRYHSDGDIRPILPDLIELGIDILNPVQPECMPVDEVIPQYQDQVAFWGMVGTQTVMPFGSPDDVRRIVAECGRLAAAGAAVIVAPTHVLEPDVPDANILALVEAVHAARLDGAATVK